MIRRIRLGDGVGHVVGQNTLSRLANAIHAHVPGTVNVQSVGDSLTDADVGERLLALVEAQVAVIHGILTEQLNIGVGLGSGDIHAGEVVADVSAAGLDLDVAVAILGDDLELHLLDGGLTLDIVVIKGVQLNGVADGPVTPGVGAGADIHVGPLAVAILIALLAEHKTGWR